MKITVSFHQGKARSCRGVELRRESGRTDPPTTPRSRPSRLRRIVSGTHDLEKHREGVPFPRVILYEEDALDLQFAVEILQGGINSVHLDGGSWGASRTLCVSAQQVVKTERNGVDVLNPGIRQKSLQYLQN